MELIDITPNTYFAFDDKNNYEILKFNVGNQVRISKYNNSF